MGILVAVAAGPVRLAAYPPLVGSAAAVAPGAGHARVRPGQRIRGPIVVERGPGLQPAQDPVAGDDGGELRLPRPGYRQRVGIPSPPPEVHHLGRRGQAELRDQFPTYQGRRFSLFAALRDGAGEAKIDLRPDSDFLRDLNDRPWPAEVPILAIAGRLLAAPADLTEGLEAAATAIGSPKLERRLSAWWSGIGEDLGDGVVSLASAGLPGGPTPVIVDATHRGMLARLFPGDPEPPAIAPILAAIRDWNATTATAPAGAVGNVP